MKATGITMPDDVMEIVNGARNKWRTSRSRALVRIVLEWQEQQDRQDAGQPTAQQAEKSPMAA